MSVDPDEVRTWRVARDMLAFALTDFPQPVADLCTQLDEAQLQRVATAARLIATSADAEAGSRPPRLSCAWCQGRIGLLADGRLGEHYDSSGLAWCPGSRGLPAG